MPANLFIDFETASLADLREVGIDNYARNKSTYVSMLAWALDDEDVRIWLPHNEPIPELLLSLLRDDKITLIAWNASFEWNIFNHVLKVDLPFNRFRDPMVLAHNLSLPGSLEKAALCLKMAEQKDERGDVLKKMFCQPVSMGGEMTLFGISPPLFRDHISHPREFAEYVEYCKQDVRAERALWYRMSKIGFPEIEWEGWLLDQKINQFGIPGRRDLAEKGLRLALRFITDQKKLCKELTGLENPNSDVQMKAWATARGYPYNSMRAPTVAAAIADPNSQITPECKIALKARASARKSSYTKIEKFLSLLSNHDDRLRYQFRYLGASRTGRWASGGGEDASMQVQNLPRGAKAVKKKLDLALKLLEAEDYEGIVREFTNTPNPKDSITVVDFVITLLRSLFQAGSGKKFIVADKNAIENRMLGWAAGCKAILDVFRTCDDCGFVVDSVDGGFHCPKCGSTKARCPYLSFGTHLYNKTYAEMRATYKAGNEDERQNSKPPVLGGGYGLGGGEMYINEYGDEVRGGLWGYALSVCGVDMPKELAHKAVKILRDAWPEVVQFWTDLEEAFKQVFKRGGVIKVGEVTWNRQQREWVEHPTKGKQCVIAFRRFKMDDGGYSIRMELPSGRALHYLNVTIEEEKRTSKKTGNEYTAQTIFYDGIEHSATQGADGKTEKKRHKWGRVKTYGGKICLGGRTQVITYRGLKNLDQITLDDLVWDGVEWVHHDGLAYNGLRETATWMGLTGTPNHQILGGNEWHELGKTTNLNGLCSLLTGLASAVRLWCSLNQASLAVLGFDVTAGRFLMSAPMHYGETKLTHAHLVDVQKEAQDEPRDSAIMSSSIKNYARCGFENSQISSPDAITQSVLPTIITEGGVLSATSLGEEAGVSGWSTQLRFLAGTTQLLNLIESTTTGITNREISASSLAQRIQTIVEQLSGLVGMEKNFPTKSFASDLLRSGARTLSIIISSADAPLNGVWPDTNKQRVYDLRNCGPRHRFMVMTSGGPVLVHNCENAIQAMSRDDLLNSMFIAAEMGFNLWGLFHDELAAEVEDTWDGLQLSDLIWCLCQVPWWAKGLLLGAEGYESQVYKKG